MPLDQTIVAVVVTYQPDPGVAARIAAILPQVSRVVVVDNASDAEKLKPVKDLAASQPVKLHLLRSGDNIGLGAAQNLGIREAAKAGFDWILLLDQDSEPAPGMVARMAENAGGAAILTPRITDVYTGEVYPCLMKDGWKFKRIVQKPGEDVDGLFSCLASGSLIRREVFAKIGLMREDFFMDYIDWDFTSRARQVGFSIRAVGNAAMQHAIGRKEKVERFGLVWTRINQSPARYYTQSRNRIVFLLRHGFRDTPVVCYTLSSLGIELIRAAAVERGVAAKLWQQLKGTLAGLLMAAKPYEYPRIS